MKRAAAALLLLLSSDCLHQVSTREQSVAVRGPTQPVQAEKRMPAASAAVSQTPAPESGAPALAPGEDAQPTAADDDGNRDEGLDDEIEAEEPDSAPEARTRPHPLDGMSAEELADRLRRDPESLGSISLGTPSAGSLWNAVQVPDSPYWQRVDASHAWGTRETVDYLACAVAAVHRHFPEAQRFYLGHVSAQHGGPLSPHISHQAGRDVDISYLYSDERAGWYTRATAKNLDLPKTWAFVRALVTEADVELILMDRSIQLLLQQYARSIGEDESWLDSLFRGSAGQRTLIIHARGHATHLHVRFYNPIAQETGRRTYAWFVQRGLIPRETHYVSHKAKNGETLGMLARKYAVSVRDIQRANGLTKSTIRNGRIYRIPRRGGVRAPPARIAVPARRLPPFTPPALRVSTTTPTLTTDERASAIGRR